MYNAPERGKMVAAVIRNEKEAAEEEKQQAMKFVPARYQISVVGEASSKALFEMQEMIKSMQDLQKYAAQVAPKKADKSLPNSPDATLVQKLKELFSAGI